MYKFIAVGLKVRVGGSSILEFLYVLTLVTLILGPMFVLIHELGHVLPVYSQSEKVYIQLGIPYKGLSRRMIITLGKIRFKIFPLILINGSFTISNWNQFSKKYKIASLLSGPIITLVMLVITITFFLLDLKDLNVFIDYLIFASSVFLFWELIFTAIPMVYSRRFGQFYDSRESDGLQVLKLISRKGG
ncbi:hypothetical protein ACSVDE_09205 [Pseudalkalibacillus sp. Hm43]|uniref:hypothetical protein n=1 Tax=Pseudalkalibacillus sp. Hm43 TaxID=3450742 RepID=UPI003F42753E